VATKKLRMVRLKKLSRRELNRRLDDQKSKRRKQSEKLLSVPDDELARVRIQQQTATIGELKQVREMLPHPVHRFLVVSSSRNGPMLYGFCRDSSCRHRVFKSSTVTVPGSSIKDWFLASQGGCAHPHVSLKRANHFDISVVCATCGQKSVVRNVFVESRHVLWPKVNWPKLGMLGDSMLPKGDPRLL
jgi:hypothetical protein